MKDIALSLVTGTLFGAVFTLLRLPLPAPSSAAGVAGVAGVFLGMIVVSWIGKGVDR
jgi:XapX domain-containing protein